MTFIEPYWFFSLLIGLCVGSFLNVVIYRLPRGRSIVSPGSHCSVCKSSIVWWANVPILGYLISRGQCTKCHAPYSARYVLVEFLMAVMAWVAYAQSGWTPEFFVRFVFYALLIAVTFIDLDLKIIPDELSLGGCALFLMFALLGVGLHQIDFMNALIAAAVGAGFFWATAKVFYFLTQNEGLGGGDVKLMALVGAALGLEGILTTVLVGSVLGVLAALFLMAFFKHKKREPLPFGPFLALGALLASFSSLSVWVL